jgi:hypothetical protein
MKTNLIIECSKRDVLYVQESLTLSKLDNFFQGFFQYQYNNYLNMLTPCSYQQDCTFMYTERHNTENLKQFFPELRNSLSGIHKWDFRYSV